MGVKLCGTLGRGGGGGGGGGGGHHHLEMVDVCQHVALRVLLTLVASPSQRSSL